MILCNLGDQTQFWSSPIRRVSSSSTWPAPPCGYCWCTSSGFVQSLLPSHWWSVHHTDGQARWAYAWSLPNAQSTPWFLCCTSQPRLALQEKKPLSPLVPPTAVMHACSSSKGSAPVISLPNKSSSQLFLLPIPTCTHVGFMRCLGWSPWCHLMGSPMLSLSVNQSKDRCSGAAHGIYATVCHTLLWRSPAEIMNEEVGIRAPKGTDPLSY